MAAARLKAVVIQTSEAQKRGRARDMREINNILASVAKKKEGVEHDIPIIDYLYSAKLDAHVGIYEAEKTKVRIRSQGRSEREREDMT